MKHSIRIAWIAIRELFYEKFFYILLSFGLLSLGISALLGQLTYAEQSKLTLDFMLGGIQVSMTLFSVFVGISLFQRELTLGSVSIVLSKPISRPSFLIGKYLGQMAVQYLVTAAMGLLTWAMCSRYGDNVSGLAIFQTVVMIGFEIAVLTSIAYFFAVNAGAITAAIVTVCLIGMGHVQDTVARNIANTDAQPVWKIVRNVIPNLEIFNMKSLASYGHTLAWQDIGWAALYALCCVTFFLFMAALCFNEKDILT